MPRWDDTTSDSDSDVFEYIENVRAFLQFSHPLRVETPVRSVCVHPAFVCATWKTLTRALAYLIYMREKWLVKWVYEHARLVAPDLVLLDDRERPRFGLSEEEVQLVADAICFIFPDGFILECRASRSYLETVHYRPFAPPCYGAQALKTRVPLLHLKAGSIARVNWLMPGCSWSATPVNEKKYWVRTDGYLYY